MCQTAVSLQFCREGPRTTAVWRGIVHVVCVTAQLGSRSVPHDVGPSLRRALETGHCLRCPVLRGAPRILEDN